MKLSIFYQKEVKPVLMTSKLYINNYVMFIICIYGLNIWLTVKKLDQISKKTETRINNAFIILLMLLAAVLIAANVYVQLL